MKKLIPVLLIITFAFVPFAYADNISPRWSIHTGNGESYFDYEKNAGDVIHGSIVATNAGDSPVTIDVLLGDARSAQGGGFAVGSEDTKSAIAQWIDFESIRDLAIEPDSQYMTPFTIHIPIGTHPGDYNSAFFALLSDPPDADLEGIGFRVISRVAIALVIRVKGPAQCKIHIDSVDLINEDNGLRALLNLTNTGALNFDGHGVFEISSNGESVFSESFALGWIGTGNTTFIPLSFSKPLQPSDYIINSKVTSNEYADCMDSYSQSHRIEPKPTPTPAPTSMPKPLGGLLESLLMPADEAGDTETQAGKTRLSVFGISALMMALLIALLLAFALFTYYQRERRREAEHKVKSLDWQIARIRSFANEKDRK